MAIFYKSNVQRTRGERYVLCANTRFSSKRDAFLEGMGSVMDVFPDPRPRAIRAFVSHHGVKAVSVQEAIWGDWAAIAQDMWAAIDEHAAEKSEEAAAGTRALTTR